MLVMLKWFTKPIRVPNLKLHIVLEHFTTPTAMLAHYVLPIASKLERGVRIDT